VHGSATAIVGPVASATLSDMARDRRRSPQIAAGFLVAAFGYTTLFRVLSAIGISLAVAFALATRVRGR
jgi:hypothetical protein